MTDLTIPAARPVNPRFSSGPCAKIPHYSLDMLSDAPLGRSHRAAVGKSKLAEAIDLTRAVLGVPRAQLIAELRRRHSRRHGRDQREVVR